MNKNKSPNIKIISTVLFVIIIFHSSLLCAQDYQRFIVNTLSAPEMEGRAYVNKGAEKAAEFIRYQFDSLGLAPFDTSYFQKFDLKVNCFPGAMQLSIDGKQLIPGKDFIVDPHSGKGKAEEYTLKKINIYKPKQLEKLLKNMYSLNETALLIDMPDTLSSNGRMLFMQTVYLLCEQWPVVLLSHEKLTWGIANSALSYPLFILSDYPVSDKEKITFEVDASLITSQQKNVIAIKKSADPNAKYFIISAHYDHLGRMGQETYFPGANDNASGVAEMLALAASLDTILLNHHLVFIAFAAEEAGLVGSQYYVNNPLFPLNQIDFLLNLDLNGTGEEGITVVNATEFKEIFSILVNDNEEVQAVSDIKERGPAANSDHYPFYQKGVPSFFIYTRGGIKAYHDIYDKAETLPLTKAENLIQLYTAFFIALDSL